MYTLRTPVGALAGVFVGSLLNFVQSVQAMENNDAYRDSLLRHALARQNLFTFYAPDLRDILASPKDRGLLTFVKSSKKYMSLARVDAHAYEPIIPSTDYTMALYIGSAHAHVQKAETPQEINTALEISGWNLAHEGRHVVQGLCNRLKCWGFPFIKSINGVLKEVRRIQEASDGFKHAVPVLPWLDLDEYPQPVSGWMDLPSYYRRLNPWYLAMAPLESHVFEQDSSFLALVGTLHTCARTYQAARYDLEIRWTAGRSSGWQEPREQDSQQLAATIGALQKIAEVSWQIGRYVEDDADQAASLAVAHNPELTREQKVAILQHAHTYLMAQCPHKDNQAVVWCANDAFQKKILHSPCAQRAARIQDVLNALLQDS